MNVNRQSAGLILGFIAYVVCVPVPTAVQEFSLQEYAILGECHEPDLRLGSGYRQPAASACFSDT